MQSFQILVWLKRGQLVTGLMCPLKLWVHMAMQHLNMLLQVNLFPLLRIIVAYLVIF